MKKGPIVTERTQAPNLVYTLFKMYLTIPDGVPKNLDPLKVVFAGKSKMAAQKYLKLLKVDITFIV